MQKRANQSRRRSNKQLKQKREEWERYKEREAEFVKPRLRPAKTQPEKWLKHNYPKYFQHLSKSQISKAWERAKGDNERFVDECRKIIYHYDPNRISIISTPIGGQPPYRKRPLEDN